MVQKFNILVVNQPINNRGDEAAHKALIRLLVQSVPNVKINVLFLDRKQDSVNQFDVNSENVSYLNIRTLKGWKKIFDIGMKLHILSLAQLYPTIKTILNLYKHAHLVLCAPGGICMGGFQNWGHIFMLSVAKYLRKPIAYYGRSIGPFPAITHQNRLFREKSLELLNYFSFISLRDEKSMKLADELHVKYVPTVDSAFLESPHVDIPSDIENALALSPYVVFVPNLLIWHFAYKDKAKIEDVLNFYKKILACIVARYTNHNVVMLPQTFNYGTYEGDDINFFKDLKRYTQYEKLIIIPDTYSSDIQQTIISQADCMIGARYHSIVFALNQAIPFVALSYEHKIQGLLEILNKTESMVDITETFDSDEKMQTTIAQFAQALKIAHKDENSQKKAKNIAKVCFENFVHTFLKNA